MISIPVFLRTARDYFLLWLGLAVLLIAFIVLFTIATNSSLMEQGVEHLKTPFIRKFLTVLMGTDVVSMLSPTVIASFGFTHPLTWTVIIVFCLTVTSGSLAGEMDRGTIDLLAGLPLSRASIYNAVGLVVLLKGWVMCWGVWVGTALGRMFVDNPDIHLDLLARVAGHLCVTYTLIASFSLAISGGFSRRGPAVALSFFLVFYCFVLNVLRAIWPGFDALRWTDFLYYYQTVVVVRDEAFKWRDIAVLMSASAIWWGVGLVVFTQRDIPAR